MMSGNPTLLDARDWSVATAESPDAIRCLEKAPARLGLLDCDLATLPAGLVSFERNIAGRGYALVGRAKNVVATGRRADSRVRALLRRFWTQFDGSGVRSEAATARWTALIGLIAAQEGRPGSGKRWNMGRHRSLTILRARSGLAPEALVQMEVDRIAPSFCPDGSGLPRRAIG